MWRDMNQINDKAEKKPISIARCYPMKNRVPDVLPFDNSRVELPTTKGKSYKALFKKAWTSFP